MALARHESHTLRYVLTQQPAVEPVSLAQVKEHRRLDADDTSQDLTLALLITTARRYAEAYTGQSFITQKWRATMDRFPGVMLPATPYAASAAWLPTPQPSNEIQLLHGPIQSVDLITYLDANGASQTLATSKWTLDASGIFPRIAPTYGNAWPDTLPQIGAVTVDFTAGYGATAPSVPVEIVHWMLVRIGSLFENREEVAVMTRGKLEPLPYVDGLLDFNRAPVL